MNRKSQTLRAVGMLALMGGSLYALAGCGGTSSSGTIPINPTDTAIPSGQRLYVANQTAAGSAQVFRYDQILQQATGTIISPAATFSGLNTVGRVVTDFAGDLLVADAGANVIDDYAGAATAVGTVTVPNKTVAATAPSSAVFDSSNQFFYATTLGKIQQFSAAGTPTTALVDSLLANPVALAIDDVHRIGASNNTGVLFAAGTTGAKGVVDIIADPQGLVGTGDIAGNANVDHLTQIAGINLVNPTALAYDNQHLQLWIADPGAGFVFRIDNANNLTAGSNALGGAFQIPANNVAVDFSSGFATLMTMNSAASANTLNVFPFATGITTTVGEVTAANIPTPIKVTLNGVTNATSINDDSVH